MLIALALTATLALPASAPAKKSPFKPCKDVTTKIGGKSYKVATKVQAKGVTCAQATNMLAARMGGEIKTPLDPKLTALSNRCKDDKKQPAGAVKARRTAWTCTSADGKRSIKSWVLKG